MDMVSTSEDSFTRTKGRILPHEDTRTREILMFRSCHLNGHTNSLVQRSGGYYLREHPNRQETHFQMSLSHWPYNVFDQTKELIPPQEAQQSPNQLRSHTECSQSVLSLHLSLLSPAKNKRLCIDRLEGLGLGLRPSSCKMHIALTSSNLRFSLIKPDMGAGDNLRGGVYVVVRSRCYLKSGKGEKSTG